MKSFSIKLGVIIIGLIIFGCAGMRGKNWKFFSSTDFYKGFYYVSESHFLYKGTIHAWIKLEYTEKGIAEYVKELGKDYGNLSYSLQYWEINCRTKQRHILSVNQYSVQGNVLKTKPPKDSFLRSFGDSLLGIVCE